MELAGSLVMSIAYLSLFSIFIYSWQFFLRKGNLQFLSFSAQCCHSGATHENEKVFQMQKDNIFFFSMFSNSFLICSRTSFMGNFWPVRDDILIKKVIFRYYVEVIVKGLFLRHLRRNMKFQLGKQNFVPLGLFMRFSLL